MQVIQKWEKRLLGRSEAHLWVYVDQRNILPARCVEVLDIHEKNRYDQYPEASKKREFLIGRLFLKHILAQYTERYPTRIKILLDNQRKPFLQDHIFHINLSHSHNVYACLIGQKPLGVDVEYVLREPLKNHFSHVFTDAEIRTLQSLKETEKGNYFFQLWTMKEAFWKAWKNQENLPFNQFSVSFDPVSVHDVLPEESQKSWHFAFENSFENYLIAMAIEKNPEESLVIKTFQFAASLQNNLFTYP